MERIPQRTWADPRDESVPGDSETFGVRPSPDAIGGYYGIGWHEFFRDRNTGEVYKVRCTDGVYGGRGPYPPSREEEYNLPKDRPFTWRLEEKFR